GTANSDTGLGLSFGISDDNILGLGDKINTSVSVNSKSLLFNIDYQQYFTSNPYLSNRYRFFNSEKDFTSSYGYKSKNIGISYSIYYDIDDQTSSNIGIDYTNNENHSATISSDNSISDSIGEFNNFKIFYSLTKDNTNNRLYPSEGSLNKLFLELSPDELSDDPFIRITLKNTIFFDNTLNSNFFFIDNNIGLAESLKGKLKTKETFNLGGLNFKGFKYNGIGPSNSNNIYLGGNKYFTSTLGYGSKFLFDEKDNVNFKIFTTVGSLWDSDYTISEFKLRSSAGISFDFLTAVGPISFSYSVPINKSNKDESDNFNFTIGTSF
ncbi:MAG: BamA/TamA family outer membrane protein, partial [Alphaproteobacteria bacterium]